MAKQPKPRKRKKKPGAQTYTEDQIRKRRLAVWEMMCCGRPVAEIATALSVSERTVARDRLWWRRNLGLGVEQLRDPKYAAMDVGMTAAKLQKFAEDAYVEFLTASSPVVKGKMLECAGKMLVSRHKLLADAGFLPKKPKEDEEPVAKISFEARFDAPSASVLDDPVSRRRILEAVAAYVQIGGEIFNRDLKRADVKQIEADVE